MSHCFYIYQIYTQYEKNPFKMAPICWIVVFYSFALLLICLNLWTDSEKGKFRSNKFVYILLVNLSRFEFLICLKFISLLAIYDYSPCTSYLEMYLTLSLSKSSLTFLTFFILVTDFYLLSFAFCLDYFYFSL